MQGFAELVLQDRVFLLLAAAILLLLLLTFLFAVVTIVLRIRNERRTRYWEYLEGKWNEVILEVLAGSEPPEALTRLVEPEEHLFFVGFLLRYARRVRGEEGRVLHEMAAPFLSTVAERAHEGGSERRARAIQTLGTMGVPEYAEIVQEALDDPSALVAMLAAQGLARKEHPELLGPVLDHLHRFGDWRRSYLAGMLAAVGPEAAPLLVSVLDDADRPPWVRAVVADALRLLFHPGAADIAAKVAVTEKDPDLLIACLRILTEVGHGEHCPAVRPLVSAPEFAVRAQALKALRNLGDVEELPLLVEALEDESPWVAMEAARGLRALGGEERLKHLAASEDPKSPLARQILAE